MLSPIARCSHCGDEYDPVEYRTVPVDPDEVQLCSSSCEDAWTAAEDASGGVRVIQVPGPGVRPLGGHTDPFLAPFRFFRSGAAFVCALSTG